MARPAVPVTLHTDDGVRIDAGRFEPVGGVADLGVVVAHGLTGSWHRPPMRAVAAVLAGHCGVLAVDLRGHGRSGGLSTVGDREVADIAAAVAHLTGRGYRRVAVLGFSMGAAVAVRYAGLRGGVAAAVSVSGPSRWYDRRTPAMRRAHWAIEQRSGRFAVHLARRTRISPAGWYPVPASPVEVAGAIAPAPLLVVHGDADPYFGVAHGRRLYAAAREPRELWIERGFGHAEGAAGGPLIDRIGRWLAAHALPAADPATHPGPVSHDTPASGIMR